MHAVIYAPTADDLETCYAYAMEHDELNPVSTAISREAAIEHATANAGMLVTHRLTDLADSLKGLRDLTRKLNAHGAAWATVAESLSSKQKPVARLLEALAVIEHESHVRKGQRAASARKGQVMTLHPGKVRYGWKLVDGQLVEDEREQKAIRLMLSCHAAGHSLPAIIEALLMQGFQPRGKRWFPDTVAKVLKRHASSPLS